jgi:hypothetical protein
MHACYLGESERDFRVSNGEPHPPGAAGVWLLAGALVVEIVSPGDQTWEELRFCAKHEVDEVRPWAGPGVAALPLRGRSGSGHLRDTSPDRLTRSGGPTQRPQSGWRLVRSACACCVEGRLLFASK